MKKEQLLQCIKDSFDYHIEGIKHIDGIKNILLSESINLFEEAKAITLSEITMRPYEKFINPHNIPF